VKVSLEELLPYGSWRTGQKEIAVKVYDTVKKGSKLLVEAPTGAGKTLATLIGALKGAKEEGLKVFFLARTKNQALTPLKEAFNIARKGLPLRVAVFRSKKEMCVRNEAKMLNYEEFIEYCNFLKKEELCKYFSKVMTAEEAELSSILGGYESPLEAIKELRSHGYCPYEAFRRWGAKADLIIGSYPYIFNESIREAFLNSLDVRLRDLILIIDEAHNLYDYLSEAYSETLPLAYVKRAKKEAKKYLKEEYELYVQVMETLTGLERYLSKLRVRQEVSKSQVLALYSDVKAIEEASRLVALRKREVEGTPLCYLKRVVRFLKALESGGKEYLLISSPNEVGPKLTLQCVLPSVKSSEIFENSRSVILMSATMPPKDFLIRTIGIEEPVDEVRVNIEAVKRRRLILIATDVTSRYKEREESVYRRMAEYVTSCYDALPSSSVLLVVAPSYELLASISRNLRGVEVIEEDESTKIEEVRSRVLSKLENKVVLLAVAGGKMVEGVELVEEARSLIRGVVIAGLPYPEPSPKVLGLKRLLEEEVKSGREAWEGAFLIPMLIRVKQAIGRAIRSEEDRAAILILDRRALDKRVMKELRELSEKVMTVNDLVRVKNVFKTFLGGA